MGLPSRRLAWLGVIAFAAASWAFAACAIDEGGTESGSDASLQDVIVVEDHAVDVFIETAPPPPPLSCEEAGTALDASCLGESIPAGWEPVAWQTAQVGCPTDAGFYDVYSAVTNVTLGAGACSCSGCTAQGAWSCNAQVAGGGGCTTDKADGGASFCANINGHTSFSETIERAGNPTCSGGAQNGNATTTSQPLSLCLPSSCETDFCRLGSLGYKLCVYNAQVTDGGCPDNVFKVPTPVIGGAKVVCDSCQACALTNPDAGCTGTTTAYDTANCTGNVLGTSIVSGTCANSGTNYSSLGFEAGPAPTPICSGANVTTGQVAQASNGTICCTQ